MRWPIPLRRIHQGVYSDQDNQGYEQPSHLEPINNPKETSQQEVSVLNSLIKREKREQLPEHLEKLIDYLTEEQKCVLRHCLQKSNATLKVIADSLGVTMYRARCLKKFELPHALAKFCQEHSLEPDEVGGLLRILVNRIRRTEK